MSRYKVISSNRRYEIYYGFDPEPLMGGYFFQVSDREAITDNNEEGYIVDEGFYGGINWGKMSTWLSVAPTLYGFNPTNEYKQHLAAVLEVKEI